MRRSLYIERNAEFIEAWNEADEVYDVAIRFGLSLNTARVRATRLRAHGVPLKSMKHRPNAPNSIRRFVEVWNAAESAQDAAAGWGCPDGSARTRAHRARRQGLDAK